MNPNKQKIIENDMVKDFFTKFYDISCSIESSNYTIDEFYDEFPEEMHSFLGKYTNDG